MIAYLTRQFGMLGFGLCILASAATISGDLHALKSTVRDAIVTGSAVNSMGAAMTASDINRLSPPCKRCVPMPEKSQQLALAALGRTGK